MAVRTAKEVRREGSRGKGASGQCRSRTREVRMVDPVIQSVWVTDATRTPDERGPTPWQREEYDQTLDVTGRRLLDAVREHTATQSRDLGVPHSAEWANGAVVTRWQDPYGHPDLRRARFVPRDHRGVRIGGCLTHKPTD